MIRSGLVMYESQSDRWHGFTSNEWIGQQERSKNVVICASSDTRNRCRMSNPKNAEANILGVLFHRKIVQPTVIATTKEREEETLVFSKTSLSGWMRGWNRRLLRDSLNVSSATFVLFIPHSILCLLININVSIIASHQVKHHQHHPLVVMSWWHVTFPKWLVNKLEKDISIICVQIDTVLVLPTREQSTRHEFSSRCHSVSSQRFFLSTRQANRTSVTSLIPEFDRFYFRSFAHRQPCQLLDMSLLIWAANSTTIEIDQSREGVNEHELIAFVSVHSVKTSIPARHHRSIDGNEDKSVEEAILICVLKFDTHTFIGEDNLFRHQLPEPTLAKVIYSFV